MCVGVNVESRDRVFVFCVSDDRMRQKLSARSPTSPQPAHQNREQQLCLLPHLLRSPPQVQPVRAPSFASPRDNTAAIHIAHSPLVRRIP